MAPFLGWTFALAIPFWIAGIYLKSLALPGLPVADTMIVVCPLCAASLLTRRRGGSIKRLLARSVDWRRVKSPAWYVPSLLLVPACTLVSYVWMRATEDVPPIHVRSTRSSLLFLAFLVAAAAEELGWTAYATTCLRRHATILTTGLVVGSGEAAWHLIQLTQLGRSLVWSGWWCLWTVSARVLMVSLYEETKSVFTTMLFHASMNLSWQLFPDSGSLWDPRRNGLLLAGMAAITIGAYRSR